MRRTLPPHQWPTLITSGAGAKTLADLSRYPSMDSGAHAVQAVQAMKGAAQ